MPILEPSIYRPTNLTKEQQQSQLAAVYGVSRPPALSFEEVERMRQIVQMPLSVGNSREVCPPRNAATRPMGQNSAQPPVPARQLPIGTPSGCASGLSQGQLPTARWTSAGSLAAIRGFARQPRHDFHAATPLPQPLGWNRHPVDLIPLVGDHKQVRFGWPVS